MLYRCEHCGALFSEPSIKRWREPMPDGFFEPWACEVCPECGEEEIEEVFDEIVDADPFEPEPEWVQARREWEECHD